MPPRRTTSSPRPPRSDGPRPSRPAADSGAAEAPHGSRPEQVYLRLRELIVQGLLAPGSRVVETEVAARLGVSRTPVREALQRLQQEGFVVGAPGAQQARLTVAPLTRADVHELLNIVGEIEGLGARWAAALDPAERRALTKELKGLNAEFHRTGRTAPIDHGRLYEADERLHRSIVEASSGPRLIAMHDSVKPQAERYIRMYISMLTSDIRASVAEHDAIIDAIDAGESDDAQRAVQLNWRHAADRIGKVIEVAGERGSW
jgi:DNA-binding GntR family transcriptional regulator